MSDSRIVVDASAVVALLIDPSELGERTARRLLNRQLHAPDHLPVEVTNVLRRQKQRGALSETEAQLALHGLWSLPIELWPFEVLRERAWDLGGNVSSYDAAYVALAERLDAPLLTADARLSRAPGAHCTFDLID